MIQTAEEFGTPLLPRGIDYWYKEFNEMMIEFAKLHVKATLEAVVDLDAGISSNTPGNWVLKQEDRKKNIMNCYPETNIK